MLTSRMDRHGCLACWLVAISVLTAPLASAQIRPTEPFIVPKNRADWEARRPEVVRGLGGKNENKFPVLFPFTAQFGRSDPFSPNPEILVEQVQAIPTPQPNSTINGLFLRPVHAPGEGRLPLIVLLVDPHPDGAMATASGWDGRSPAQVLIEMGFAVLIFDHPYLGAEAPIAFDYPLRAALDATLVRPEIDPARVAVFGLGRTGMTALSLMVHDPRITCGVVAIESKATTSFEVGSAGGYPLMAPSYFQEKAALCAPRPLCLMIGEPLPLPSANKSAGRLLERAAKGTYKLYGKESQLSFTLFGEFAGHESISTRLQWLMGLEWLDKHFRPQEPTPLGHEPEPEPTIDVADPTVLNLTEHGIAGWSSEMSFRPSTFTWKDGVVVCQPGPHEYGWLRAPVEVDDFLLQVEWQVPPRGNAGIFLRGKPVDWVLPPTEENKLRISTLALTWPSRTGLELQTQDDAGIANRYSSGSLYRHAAPSENPTTPPGQWNRSTVRARGTRVEVWNNGKQVLDTDLTTSSDTLPNPPLRGFIGLQNHGNAASYRNVKLKRLRP